MFILCIQVTPEFWTGIQDVSDELDNMYIEGLEKLNHGENICNMQSVPEEHSIDDIHQVSSNKCMLSVYCDYYFKCIMFHLKEILEETKEEIHAEVTPDSPESMVEKLEQQELETPEPRASTKLVSDGSSEQSEEMQEKPSPVSVLESFFEDFGSPDCINKKECKSKQYNLV